MSIVMDNMDKRPSEPIGLDDMKTLVIKLNEIGDEVKLLRRSLLGSYDKPGGMAQKIVILDQDLKGLESKVNHVYGDVKTLQGFAEATKNRAIGISIGVMLGGAGIGAGVATIVSKVIGGP